MSRPGPAPFHAACSEHCREWVRRALAKRYFVGMEDAMNGDAVLPGVIYQEAAHLWGEALEKEAADEWERAQLPTAWEKLDTFDDVAAGREGAE